MPFIYSLFSFAQMLRAEEVGHVFYELINKLILQNHCLLTAVNSREAIRAGPQDNKHKSQLLTLPSPSHYGYVYGNHYYRHFYQFLFLEGLILLSHMIKFGSFIFP